MQAAKLVKKAARVCNVGELLSACIHLARTAGSTIRAVAASGDLQIKEKVGVLLIVVVLKIYCSATWFLV